MCFFFKSKKLRQLKEYEKIWVVIMNLLLVHFEATVRKNEKYTLFEILFSQKLLSRIFCLKVARGNFFSFHTVYFVFFQKKMPSLRQSIAIIIP